MPSLKFAIDKKKKKLKKIKLFYKVPTYFPYLASLFSVILSWLLNCVLKETSNQ